MDRPALPDTVKQRIAALLKQGRSYSYICNRYRQAPDRKTKKIGIMLMERFFNSMETFM